MNVHKYNSLCKEMDAHKVTNSLVHPIVHEHTQYNFHCWFITSSLV